MELDWRRRKLKVGKIETILLSFAEDNCPKEKKSGAYKKWEQWKDGLSLGWWKN